MGQESLNQTYNKQQPHEDKEVEAQTLSRRPAKVRKERPHVRMSTENGILTINPIPLSESSTQGLSGFLIGMMRIA
jgi:hypothetical protein